MLSQLERPNLTHLFRSGLSTEASRRQMPLKRTNYPRSSLQAWKKVQGSGKDWSSTTTKLTTKVSSCNTQWCFINVFKVRTKKTGENIFQHKIYGTVLRLFHKKSCHRPLAVNATVLHWFSKDELTLKCLWNEVLAPIFIPENWSLCCIDS